MLILYLDRGSSMPQRICVGYARVSKDEQADETHAFEQQKRLLEENGCLVIYSDILSRIEDDRPSFQRLLDDCEKGRISLEGPFLGLGIEEVVVTRVDRFSGKVTTLLSAIDRLSRWGVRMRSIQGIGSIDPNSASGRLQLTMEGAFAEAEVRRLTERIRAGHRDLRKQGRAPCRIPFGYRRYEDRLVCDDAPFLSDITTLSDGGRAEVFTRWEFARKIVDLFFEAGSVSKTAKLMADRYGFRAFKRARLAERDKRSSSGKSPHSGALRFYPPLTTNGIASFLRNPNIRGHSAHHRDDLGNNLGPKKWWIAKRDCWPAVLSDTEYAEIEQIISFNRNHKKWGGATRYTYSLTGLVTCGECRSTMLARRSPIRNPVGERTHHLYFRCRQAEIGMCDNHRWVRMENCEKAVIDALCARSEQLSEDLARGVETIPDPEPEPLARLRTQLAGLEALGENPDIEAARQGLRRQIAQYEVSPAEEMFGEKLKEDLLSVFGDRDFLGSLPPGEMRQTFSRYVQSLAVLQGAVVSVDLNI